MIVVVTLITRVDVDRLKQLFVAVYLLHNLSRLYIKVVQFAIDNTEIIP
jgi:hypothetical protein